MTTHSAQHRVVIVGAGRFGTLHLRVWTEAGAQIVGLVEADAVRLAQLASDYAIANTDTNLKSLLKRVTADIVVIATDESTHTELALEALSAGAHVLVEKPFALSSADAVVTSEAAKRSGLHVFVGHISRFAQPYTTMRQQLIANRIGEVMSVRLRRDFSRTWFETFGDRVNPVWESCIHDIDLAIFLLGAAPTQVVAQRSRVASELATSVVTALISFEGGAMATIETAWTIPVSAPQTESGALALPGTIIAEAEAHGTRGILKQRLLNDSLTIWTDEETSSPNPFLWPLAEGEVGGALRHEIEYVIDVVAGRRPNDVLPVEHAEWGVWVAEAIVASLESGSIVHR